MSNSNDIPVEFWDRAEEYFNNNPKQATGKYVVSTAEFKLVDGELETLKDYKTDLSKYFRNKGQRRFNVDLFLNNTEQLAANLDGFYNAYLEMQEGHESAFTRKIKEFQSQRRGHQNYFFIKIKDQALLVMGRQPISSGTYGQVFGLYERDKDKPTMVLKEEDANKSTNSLEIEVLKDLGQYFGNIENPRESPNRNRTGIVQSYHSGYTASILLPGLKPVDAIISEHPELDKHEEMLKQFHIIIEDFYFRGEDFDQLLKLSFDEKKDYFAKNIYLSPNNKYSNFLEQLGKCDFGGPKLNDKLLYLIKNSSYDNNQRLGMFYRIIEEVSKLHKVGYLHNDLKEANIIINMTTKTVALIDFGEVLRIDDCGKNNRFKGSPLYSAPEVLKGYPDDNERTIFYKLFFGKDSSEGGFGQAEFSTKSDVFSLGLMGKHFGFGELGIVKRALEHDVSKRCGTSEFLEQLLQEYVKKLSKHDLNDHQNELQSYQYAQKEVEAPKEKNNEHQTSEIDAPKNNNISNISNKAKVNK